MNSLCACPLPATLPAFVDFSCPENWDQIQKVLAFLKNDKDSINWFANEAALDVEANWDTLLASGELRITPYIHNIIIPPSEEQTEGGNDNTTINGVETYLGEGFVKVTGELKSAPADVRRALTEFGCFTQSEIGVSLVEGFYLARNNKLIYVLAAGETKPSGHTINNFRVSDPGSEGFNAKTKAMVSWSMQDGWSLYIKVIDLSFDLLSKVNV